MSLVYVAGVSLIKLLQKSSARMIQAVANMRSLAGDPTLTADACLRLAEQYAPTHTPQALPGLPKRLTTPKRRGPAKKANGKPRLEDAISAILGDSLKPLRAAEILEALTVKGWAPNSVRPLPYITLVLVQNRKRFARVSRGQYTLKSRVKDLEATLKESLKRTPPKNIKTSPSLMIETIRQIGSGDLPTVMALLKEEGFQVDEQELRDTLRIHGMIQGDTVLVTENS
jgi:hypothetical protein